MKKLNIILNIKKIITILIILLKILKNIKI